MCGVSTIILMLLIQSPDLPRSRIVKFEHVCCFPDWAASEEIPTTANKRQSDSNKHEQMYSKEKEKEKGEEQLLGW